MRLNFSSFLTLFIQLLSRPYCGSLLNNWMKYIGGSLWAYIEYFESWSLVTCISYIKSVECIYLGWWTYRQNFSFLFLYILFVRVLLAGQDSLIINLTINSCLDGLIAFTSLCKERKRKKRSTHVFLACVKITYGFQESFSYSRVTCSSRWQTQQECEWRPFKRNIR